MVILLAEKDVMKEIEDIKARLEKVERHVESCNEHEGKEGHEKEHGKPHMEHGK